MVGFRDGSLIDHVVRAGATPEAAADAVRAERPQCLVVAVIESPDTPNRVDRVEYSDLPDRYQELRRYAGPPGGHHGYMVVTLGMDGSRGSIPNRPVSLKQARWHRDWMLRGYFKQLRGHLQRPYFSALHVPEIVRLEVIDQ